MPDPNQNSLTNQFRGTPEPYFPVPAAQAVIETSPSDSFQLDLAKLFRRYALLAMAFTFLGAAGGFISVGLVAPVYKSRGLLEVQPVGSGILRVQPGRDFDGGEVGLQTEAQILQSNTFLRQVVRRLQLESVTPAPIQSDIFSKLRRFLKTDTSDDVSTALGMEGLDTERAPKALAVALESLQAHPVLGTRLIEVTCESTNPQFAADFLNALIDEYIQHNYQARMEVVQSTTRWVSGQLEETKAKMLESEQRLQEFIRNSGNPFLTQENTLSDSRLKELQSKLSLAESDLITKQALYETVQKASPEALPNVIDDPAVRQYTTRIAELRREEANLTTKLTPEHPRVKAIEAQITEVQATQQKELASVVKRITSQYQQAQRNQELLKNSYAGLGRQIASQGGKDAQYNALKKESDTAREAYNTVLKAAQEASIAGSVPVNNIQPIDRAMPPQKPSKPRPIVNIGMGAMVGLGLCCGIAFLREKKMDPRVGSPHHARQLFDLPQLGVIPSVEETAGRRRFLPALGRAPRDQYETHGLQVLSDRDHSGPASPAIASQKLLLAESFRVTLASLMRQTTGPRRPQVILVTSPGPEEGKTTVTSNLAVALAETGRRVLVFDADFRRPKVHKVFGVANTHGLVDLLAEEAPVGEYSREALGVRTSIPNLLVLPNGSQSENIAKALYSSRLRELIQRLRQEFDTILIDTPPMLHIADARVMSGMADGIVLVLRSGITDKESAIDALDRLRADKTVILGTVLNDWKPTKSEVKKSHYYSALDTYDRT